MIYLDTSALVKLIRVERESEALTAWLDEQVAVPWISSVVTEVELPRAIRTVAPLGLSFVPSVLDRLDRFEIDVVVRATAAAYGDPDLRSLDAIHLATAQVAAAGSASAVAGFVTYDSRLSKAAESAGLTVVAPS